MKSTPTTEFLNVDLDVYSRANLEPLVTAFGDRVSVMNVGRKKRIYEAHLELAKIVKNADEAVQGFGTLIEALPRSARKLWDKAKIRDFNIGVCAAMQPYSYELALSNKSVEIASRLKARIVFTIYASKVRETGV